MAEEQITTLRFSEETRSFIAKKFTEELRKSKPDYFDPEREARIFVNCLERMAEMPYPKSDGQKRRKEKLEAVANALDRLVEAARAADDSSLGYATWRGLTEAYKQPECSDRDREEVFNFKGRRCQSMVYDLQHKHKSMLDAFCLGVRLSINDLPPLDAGYSDEQKTAEWIEDYLGRMNIPFSTSDTGLAGTAFLATMELMGNDVQRAQYWLKKAREGDSWVSFIERMKEVQKRDAE